MSGTLPPNLEWRAGCLRVLDQRALPAETRYLECRQWTQVVEAIRTLAVRGAPALGIAGAYGVVLAASAGTDAGPFARAVAALAAARPTAVNLAWAVRRVASAYSSAATDPAGAALAEAQAIQDEDAGRCAAMARLGADLLPAGGWVLTHCHTGSMATGGVGTALGAIAEGHRRGLVEGVYACEARPLWQGARLTAWECGVLGMPCRLLVDGAAGSLLASGQVGAVLVGADRIAVNGDVANKVGTYPLAVLAERHSVPFYVVAPWSSVDPGLENGGGIVVEQRDEAEVLRPVAPPGARAYNPAFDVTPGALVTAIVTETGVHRRPYRLTGAAAPDEGSGRRA